MQSPLVYIVLLNYNRADLTLECIASLQKMNYGNFKILVVDNCSTDHSAETLQLYASCFIILKSDENNGFSAGNNIGIRYAISNGADYIWILNNDTIVDVETLAEMVKTSQGRNVVASKIYYFDVPNVLSYAGGEMQFKKCRNINYGEGQVDVGQYDNDCQVNYAPGCSLLIPADVVANVGLWNEDYFMYWEDVDYCIRLGKAETPILYCSRAKVWHHEGATSGKESPLTIYYGNRNRFYILKQFCPALSAKVYVYGSRFIYLLQGLLTGNAKKYIWQAFFDYKKGKKGKTLTITNGQDPVL